MLISSFMLLRADADVLCRALGPLVVTDELGPVVDRLLATARGAEDLAEVQREMEAHAATVNALLEHSLSGKRRACDLDASTPAEVVSLAGTFASVIPEIIGAPLVRSPALVEIVRMEREGALEEFRRRAESDGWCSPTAGERGLVLGWPTDVAPRDVENWLATAPDQGAAKPLLEAIRKGAPFDWRGTADLMLQGVRRASEAGSDPRGWPWEVTHRLALLLLAAQAFAASRAMHRDRHKRFIALDASPVQHDLLSDWRDLSKSREAMESTVEDGWVEIIAPGKRIGLHFNIHDTPERVIHAVRDWRGWEGLRHWAALQCLLTIAGRTGRIRWKLEDHMDALGYGERSRRDDNVRRAVADEVELLTRLELTVYHRNGELRMRGPLFSTTLRAERTSGSRWALEGLELAVHPALYEGVRSPGGALGNLWAPAPADLARIDHARHPYALALGLILPIRWRWDLAKGRECVTLTGRGLLDAAGLRLDPRKPGRTWEALERNLDALKRIGGLGRVEWDPGGERTLAGRCHLYPPQWVRDRLIHRVRPAERPPSPSVLTGGELRAWRSARGLTQAQTAELLGLGIRTIRRAEADEKAALGRSVTRALGRLGDR
jgi:hypothetical protein